MTIRADRVEQRGEEYVILSEEGELLEEGFATREAADERLREIEAAKAARSKDGAQALIGEAGRQDSTVRRYDYCDDLHLDETRTDGVFMREDETTGFLHGEARPARTGVLIYRDGRGNEWGELRTDEEVFHPDSLRSYDLATLTNDHPEDFVSTENVGEVGVGSVGNDARRDGQFVRVSIVVRDKHTVRAIKDGKRQLSCGYTARVIADSGTTDDGVSFSGRQTDIRINHVAIVDRGRAGPACAVLARGDAYHLQQATPGSRDTMTTTKIKIGDAEHEVPTEVAYAFEAQREKLAKADAMRGRTKEDAETTNALKAKVDMLEAQAKADAETFAKRVDERSALVSAATSLGIDTASKTDAALQREVVLKVRPTMEAKLDANKDDAGYLRACYDQALELNGRRRDQETAQHEVVFNAMNEDGSDSLVEALTKYSNRGKAGA